MTDTDVIGHLIEIEAEAANMIMDAQTEADNRILEAKQKADTTTITNNFFITN